MDPWRILVLVAVIHTCFAVDRNNFKTCDQSSFCKRQRNTKPGASPWEVQLDTLNATVNSLQVEVWNVRNKVTLQLELIALADNTLRMKLNELMPLRPRYQVEHALGKEPELANLEVLQKSSDSVTLAYGNAKAVLLAKPFRLDIYVDSQLVASANARGLLKFEHQREKKTMLGRAISGLYQAFAGSSKVDKAEDENVNTNSGWLSWSKAHLRQWLPGSSNEEPDMVQPSPVSQEDANAPEIEPAREGEAVEAIKKGEAEQFEEKLAEEAEKEGANEVEPQEEVEDEHGLWEETYKSFLDSKPRGPNSVGLDFSFPAAQHVYGIPEHADSFALKNTLKTDPYRLFNTDVFEYELWNPMALYGAVPFMIAQHQNGGATGLYWQNSAETWVDVQDSQSGGMVSSLMGLVGAGSTTHKETHWFSESGIVDVFIMTGPSAKDVLRQYVRLTGPTPLPQYFALGYHQCRWNYNDQEDVMQVDAGFDKYDIPYDVIWLDIEHTDGKKYFTWDGVKFSNPKEMTQNLTSKGRKLVTIVDPHIKRDNSYFFHTECEQNDFYTKDKDGKIYEGWCWPGSSSYPDFFNPAVRQYWASRYALDLYQGTTMDTYTWNDMNEPSVFNGPEITMPRDCQHYGGWEHRDVHNMYGMMVVAATYEGQLMRSEHKLRPFILSRSFFAGSQRYGAVWTGDNIAEWSHLQISIPMLLSLSVSGVVFSGADVGGFFNNPDAELITRWYQAGAFQPFFRGHSHMHTKRREPWLFNEETTRRIREVIRKRYTYLPYWYTLFFENERTGIPPMRPLWLEYPTDKETFAMEDEHLVGDALLVKPVLAPGVNQLTVYFPGEKSVWYDIDTYEMYQGPGYVNVAAPIDKVPVFQRGGSIVPKRERARRSSSLMHKDPLTLVVCVDKTGRAEGNLYLDDGQSFDYYQQRYAYMKYQFDATTLTSQFLDDARFQTAVWLERVVIAGYPRAPVSVTARDPRTGQTKSIDFKYDAVKKLLVLRKPALPIAQEWSITLNMT